MDRNRPAIVRYLSSTEWCEPWADSWAGAAGLVAAAAVFLAQSWQRRRSTQAVVAHNGQLLPHCGAKIETAGKFCPSCGAPRIS